MKITKQALNKLKDLDTDVEKKLWNGTHYTATSFASFSKYNLELRVTKSHPLLEWASGKIDSVELIYWKGLTGDHALDIPEELEETVEELKKWCTMDDNEAMHRSNELQEFLENTMIEMGIK